MRPYAVALALALTACGGGPAPESQPSASSAVPITAEAQRIRDAVATTIEACPCRVVVRVSAYALDVAPAELTGVYDADSHSGTFQVRDTHGELEVRLVDGGVWLTTEAKAGARARWLRLDFSSMPVKPTSLFAVFAVADPGMALAMAAGTTSASLGEESRGIKVYDVTIDVPEGVAGAGPSSDLLKRLVFGSVVYDTAQVDAQGRITLAAFTTNIPEGPSGDSTLSATVRFEAFGVKGGATKPPTGPTRTVDAATFTG